MKKYIGAVTIVLIITALAFALSNVDFESVDMLLRPPKNEGQNSEIQSAFESSINDKYILRSPLSGEYKSSFILVDFNGDKNDEVVVFYSLSGAPDVARMNILCYINGAWRSIVDLESAHKQIHKVDFADVDKDNMKEIIVGWSISDTDLLNTLDVYRINSDDGNLTVEKVFESNYVDFAVCDVNSDFKSDILLFNKYHTENTSIKASYYDFSEAEAIESGSYDIDATISSVYSVCSDKDKSNGNTRIYVDGYRFDSGMTTEMFYWNKKDKKFDRPVGPDSKSIPSVATRNMIITCRDVNGDGVVEIPFEEYITESEVVQKNKSVLKQQSIIRWMKHSDNSFSCVYYEIFNPQNKYSLKIRNEWYGNFTVKSNPDEGLLTFYRVEGSDNSFDDFDGRQRNDDDFFDFAFEDNEKDDNALFSVLCVAENTDSIYDLSGYKLLKTNNGFNYYCYIYKEGKKSGITRDSLKKILVT